LGHSSINRRHLLYCDYCLCHPSKAIYLYLALTGHHITVKRRDLIDSSLYCW